MKFPACDDASLACYKNADAMCGACEALLSSWPKFRADLMDERLAAGHMKHLMLPLKRAYYRLRDRAKKGDRLAAVAAKYGVKASTDRRAVARACLKKCHPDKTPDFGDAENADLTFLLGVLKGKSL